MKRNFTNYQIELLKKAIQEEAAKDVRINKGMPQETTNLFHKWLNNPEDIIAYDALLSLLDFWKIYFEDGAEVAFEMRDEAQKALQEELAAIKEAALNRMMEEINEKLKEREQ